ncbi:unnamed protein product [Cylindrotheca closterium]|uniref:Uncharacterized protein n=1 Tax=Cylindrotheca closterium TaxID=2856 RepID=A0AAD2FXV2_9STRA|nr:unnamed protein product [Cylindrotheca closterium]
MIDGSEGNSTYPRVITQENSELTLDGVMVIYNSPIPECWNYRRHQYPNQAKMMNNFVQELSLSQDLGEMDSESDFDATFESQDMESPNNVYENDGSMQNASGKPIFAFDMEGVLRSQPKHRSSQLRNAILQKAKDIMRLAINQRHIDAAIGVMTEFERWLVHDTASSVTLSQKRAHKGTTGDDTRVSN